MTRDRVVFDRVMPVRQGLRITTFFANLTNASSNLRFLPMIQQSLLYKSNDQFWFTFFHEAKHVLQRKKKTIFLEGDASKPEDKDWEKEANDFAADLLIPQGGVEAVCLQA
ncbi:MAG: ImmA/IrrE family metallo-endopeptidase [Verrucomicrobiales bacterium]